MASNVKSLNPRHHIIIDMHIAGMRNKDIAQHLAENNMPMNQNTISTILNSPVARKMIDDAMIARSDNLDEITENARNKLKAAAADAVQKQIDLLQSTDESIALRSSKEILANIFGSTEQQVNQNLIIGSDQAANLTKALQESSDEFESK